MRATRTMLALLLSAVAAFALVGCAGQGAKSGGADKAAAKESKGATRTYYIAAEPVEWDYTPTGKNKITGKAFGETEKVFLQGGDGFVGSKYRKVLYVEYTDDTFATKKERPAEWKHLGFLGPAIRAEVGDTIKVMFKNKADREYSIHPHGVFYDKKSEGAGYEDGTSDKSDDFVKPGETYTYTWEVPERAGPTEMESSSIIWSYHSHVDETMDTNTGLVGPMIITRKGAARSAEDLKPKDVDREFVSVYWVTNENQSHELENNVKKYAGGEASEDEGAFEESNLMHNINGYMYGNGALQDLTFKKGERVRWYLMAFGSEVDLHTPHWHANTVVWNGMRSDMVELLPMSMKTADMTVDDPGIWLYHCHVNDHLDAGMITRFQVTE